MTNGASDLAGTPSDDVPGVLSTGSPGINTLFVSMAERHPEGAGHAHPAPAGRTVLLCCAL